jgi:FMN phosphatase YigB (HAD superfamily)
MKNKLILTDCDGVLFDWEYAYGRWMKKHGYEVVAPGNYNMDIKYGISKDEAKKLCRMFNESAWIRKLPPLRDAIKYIKKLNEEHGFVFHAITSLSDDYYAQHLRTKNLIEMFGPTVFEKFVYLDTGADKDEALECYRDSNCWWIEDKPQNVDLGISMGLNGILVNHEHNKDYAGNAICVWDWKKIYEIVTGGTI